jgi:hypothetical protein
MISSAPTAGSGSNNTLATYSGVNARPSSAAGTFSHRFSTSASDRTSWVTPSRIIERSPSRCRHAAVMSAVAEWRLDLNGGVSATESSMDSYFRYRSLPGSYCSSLLSAKSTRLASPPTSVINPVSNRLRYSLTVAAQRSDSR